MNRHIPQIALFCERSWISDRSTQQIKHKLLKNIA